MQTFPSRLLRLLAVTMLLLLFGAVFRLLICGIVVSWASASLAAELAFRPAADRQGHFDFDTGVLKGTLRSDGKLQGIETLIHAPSGLEVTYGSGHAGLLGHYRVFSTNTRYGHDARGWPSVPELRPDGSIEVFFPPAEDHPLEMTAIYQWTSPDTLDLATIVKPLRPMPRFEVFLSNYFAERFVGSVFLKPPRFARGAKPSLVSIDYHPLIEDNYVMFPRDREAIQIIFDGRWEQPPFPVQWCITRHLAGPLAMRRHKPTGVTAVMMAPPEDCFAVATPYDRTPPDRVAGHRSLYLSLFGQDLAKGETVRVRSRLVVRQNLEDERAIELYREYLAEANRNSMGTRGPDEKP
jgi:hypothetical protein